MACASAQKHSNRLARIRSILRLGPPSGLTSPSLTTVSFRRRFRQDVNLDRLIRPTGTTRTRTQAGATGDNGSTSMVTSSLLRGGNQLLRNHVFSDLDRVSGGPDELKRLPSSDPNRSSAPSVKNLERMYNPKALHRSLVICHLAPGFPAAYSVIGIELQCCSSRFKPINESI